ncbi:MAG TPA: hypothetical protein PLY68_07670 [Myxococcota bacterium]|nr:hypothetical protein [Myxococcota bacterium]HOD07088.1 hypothetical protein [Myxococcota bacterium]HPB51008.1 hypothetical protein [Myxococcota bacterium]HQP96055.1 hypothetical protein [Myxococcota bacterium]
MKHLVCLTAAMAALLVVSPVFADETPTEPAEAAQQTSQAAPEAAPEAASEAATTDQETAPKSAEIPDAVTALTGGAKSGSDSERWGGSFSFGQSLGLGTFVADKFARQPYYGWSISLSPRVFLYKKDLWLSAAFSMAGELSQSYSSGNTYPRVFMPSDFFVSLRYRYQIPVIKVNLQPWVRVGAPTSAESRARDLYLSTGFGFNLNRMFGKHVVLSYGFSFNKNWNGATNVLLPATSSLIRLNGAEDAGSGQAYGAGSLTTELSIRNSLMASFIINEQWSITLMIAIGNSWSYLGALPTERDEFTNENAKPGRAQSDSTSGVIDVSYQPWEHVGFSLGLASSQPAFSADNKSLRFPFFDFSSEGNNFTQFYFDVNVTY